MSVQTMSVQNGRHLAAKCSARRGRNWRDVAIGAGVLLVASLSGGGEAMAQAGPAGSINPNRDCQTVLSCNFRKDGSYRGCLSSYSCRQCRFVAARCNVGGARRGTCQRLQCSWG